MEQNLETAYREIFGKLRTRKKFSIAKIEGARIVLHEDQEICGQKEPKQIEFDSVQELETFVRDENRKEEEIKKQLSGNEMPYR